MQVHKHGGNLKEIAENYGIPRDKILDFSANINPLGPPEGLLQYLVPNLKEIVHYPEPHSLALRSLAAEKLEIPQEKVIVGNGATELLFLIMQHLKPVQVHIPYPTFSEYALAAEASGAMIHHYPLQNGFQSFSLGNISEATGPGDVVFICNPNNPTGTLFGKEDLLSLLDVCESRGAYLFLDESFTDFLEEDLSLRSVLEKSESLIILYSLTKIYALPGLRLGLLLANPQIIRQLHRMKDPWNVNHLAQAAGEFCLAAEDFLAETRQFFSRERIRLKCALEGVGEIRMYPPAANFMFFQILTSEKTVEDLQTHLIKRGIVVRNCSNYQGLNQKFFRTAIRNPYENDALLAGLKEYFR